MTGLLVLGAVALGLLICFAGYPLIRFLLGVLGFAAGAMAASLVASLTVHEPAAWVIPAAMVAGGVAGAVLAQVFFLAGVFLVGASFGALVGGVLTARFGFEPAVGVVVAAVAGGVLALGIQRLLIGLSTAFLGAWLSLSGGFVLLGLQQELVLPGGMLDQIARGGQTRFLVAWAVLGALGFAVQMRSRARPKPSQQAKES
jgi:hypothetical protein